MPLCGTKLSSFGIVVSAWGAAQLSLIGLLLHFRSVTFVEDLRYAMGKALLAKYLKFLFQVA